MDSYKLIQLAAEACDDKKGINIKVINIDKVSSLADWILIAEGLSIVQVKSIAKNVEDRIKESTDLLPLRKEGLNEGKWALLDYGDILINVFTSEERVFYDLEGFWSNGTITSYQI